jgi:hypothetical protein
MPDQIPSRTSGVEAHADPVSRPSRRPVQTTQQHYTRLLDAFGAADRTAQECVRHLEGQGMTSGQARNAVYRYRRQRGLAASKRSRLSDE